MSINFIKTFCYRCNAEVTIDKSRRSRDNKFYCSNICLYNIKTYPIGYIINNWTVICDKPAKLNNNTAQLCRCTCGYERLVKTCFLREKYRGIYKHCKQCYNKAKGRKNVKVKAIEYAPQLINEWNLDKNGGVKYEDVLMFKNSKAWWKCNKGHEWQTTLTARIRHNCPFCNSHKVCFETCILTTHPSVSKEWNYSKNEGLSPDNFSRGSTKVVWWICEEGHEWKTSIKNRCLLGNKCPFCNSPEGEKIISDILNRYSFTFKPQAFFDDCRYKALLRFDFAVYIKDKIYIIESQGTHHLYSADDDIHIRDRLKKEWCISKNIPLLEISHNEKNIEFVVLNFLKQE